MRYRIKYNPKYGYIPQVKSKIFPIWYVIQKKRNIYLTCDIECLSCFDTMEKAEEIINKYDAYMKMPKKNKPKCFCTPYNLP